MINVPKHLSVTLCHLTTLPNVYNKGIRASFGTHRVHHQRYLSLAHNFIFCPFTLKVYAIKRFVDEGLARLRRRSIRLEEIGDVHVTTD